MRDIPVWQVALSFFAVLLSGCGTIWPATFEAGKPIPDPTVAIAMKGSTKAEVRSKLGEPCAVHQKDGREWWYYEHAIIRNEWDPDRVWTTRDPWGVKTTSVKEADVLTLIFEGERLGEVREERGIKKRPSGERK